jgi:hypothetical protein
MAIESSFQPLMTKGGHIDADTNRLFDTIGYKQADFFSLPEKVRAKIADAAEKSHGIHWGLPSVDELKDKTKWSSGMILMANADKSAFYFVDDRSQKDADRIEVDRYRHVVWAKLWFEGDEVKILDINYEVYDLSLIKELAPIEAGYQLAKTPNEAKRKLVERTRDRVGRIRWPLGIFGRSEQEGLSA